MEYAYDSEELADNLVCGEPRAKSDLDNQIHPMWGYDNFRVGNIEEEVRMLKMNDGAWELNTSLLDRKIYERMGPGLRLASLLLKHSGPFFFQLMYGSTQSPEIRRLQPHGAVDDWKIRWTDVVSDPHHPPHLVATQLNAFTEHVAENSLIYIPNDDSVRDAWGETRTTLDDRCRYTIGIGSVLTKVICQPQWHKMTAQSRRYYNFQLAVTLVHELAHVAWRCRNWDDLLEDPSLEFQEVVLSPKEEQVELGQSWENWFFGGELHPIDTFEEPPRWLGFTFSSFTIDSGNEESVAYQDSTFGGNAVPASCINQFFQKKRWEAHADGSEPFSIQMTPLTSLTSDQWGDDIDETFFSRMTLNQKHPEGVPRRPFTTVW